uniref:Uncharacterized protein n=1 Tax=Rhizophora mucronata TaxID=61149 RepID=A0A2P2PHN4_RHIMU
MLTPQTLTNKMSLLRKFVQPIK